MASYNTSELTSGGAGLAAIGDADLAAVQVLESNVDFMSLFYCHLTACPPHGPFVYYTAMTLVERAKRRYKAAALAKGQQNSNAKLNEKSVEHDTTTTSSSSGSGSSGEASSGLSAFLTEDMAAAAAAAPGVFPMDAGDVSAVLEALTIPNVLAIIDRRYDTRHLSSWPLLYVPAEIRGADVALLMQQQPQQQQP